MSIALTCDCGARFEVEDQFAGQEVSCPECQVRLRAPTQTNAPMAVSMLALMSLILAVTGAFTLVGNVAAIIVACISLVRMRTATPRMQGAGYAVAAIVVALAGAGLMVGALYHPAVASLPGWLRARSVAGQLDLAVPSQVGSRDNVCVLTRPPGWGRLRGDAGIDTTIDILQTKRDILLCSPRGEAYLDIQRDASGTLDSLDRYGEQLIHELQTPPPALFEGDDENPVTARQAISATLLTRNELPPVDGFACIEWTADVRRGGRSWRWLVRAYRKPGVGKAGILYIIRAYAPTKRFESFRPELENALNSVRFPP